MALFQIWRDRHDSCRFGTYEPARAEGWLVAGCCNPAVAEKYSPAFCAHHCAAHQAREARRVGGCSIRPAAAFSPAAQMVGVE